MPRATGPADFCRRDAPAVPLEQGSGSRGGGALRAHVAASNRAGGPAENDPMRNAPSDGCLEISRLLPRLRRYARALVGSQRQGDELVQHSLQELAATAATLPRAEFRALLFRTLHASFARFPAPGGFAEQQLLVDSELVASRVGQMEPLYRQMLLLTALEGFSPLEASSILGLAPELGTRLLGEARQEVRNQSPSRALVIEDEPLIALDICTALESCGHTIVGTARTGDEAVLLGHRHRPDLIVSDLRLAGSSSGLKAVEEILAIVPASVVFITAYPELLLTGGRPQPTYVVTKPFEHEMLEVSVAEALFAAGHRGAAQPHLRATRP